MKKYLLIILCLLFQISFAQQNAEKVWNLLLENKRDEARSLFDKNFGVKKTQDFELLFLDALIDSEQGKIHFNDDIWIIAGDRGNGWYQALTDFNSYKMIY